MKGNRLKTLGFSLLGALALFLASCGQQPPPSNGGGNNPPAQTGTLEVTVLNDSNGQPIAGATVTVTPPGASIGTTNSQGKVSAPLQAGNYSVVAAASGFVTSSPQLATVTAGPTTSITIRLQPQAPAPGPGVCQPSGDRSFSFQMTPGTGGVIKSIQRTNASGEDCFVKGTVLFTVSASGASSVQIALGTTDNFQAGQVRASGTDSATLELDTATLPQGVTHYVIARVERAGRIVDQYWKVVPDNWAPQLPDVRPVNKLTPDVATDRWVNGVVELTLQDPSLVDNPNAPGLLASGVAKVIFKARRVDIANAPEINLGEATAFPYKISWNTRQYSDGRYHVYAVAQDAMGNVNTAPYSGFIVGVDNRAPTVTIAVADSGWLKVKDDLGQVINLDIFEADPGYVSGEARVTYTACDTGVGIRSGAVEIGWGSGSQAVAPACSNSSFTVDVNGVDDGEKIFRIRAQDALGNVAEATARVTVDNNAPTLDQFLINGQSPSPSLRVSAGSQATYEALAYDPTSGIREVRYYYAAPGTSPWADGGLFQIGKGTSALSRVLFPVLDPENLKATSTDSNLWVIAVAVDHAGNAKAFYHTLKVAHTANVNNGVDGTAVQLQRTLMPGGLIQHEILPTGADPNDFSAALADGTKLYVAFYSEGSFDGAALPLGLPAGMTSTVVRSWVQSVENPPYLLQATTNLNALLINEYGHWADVR